MKKRLKKKNAKKCAQQLATAQQKQGSQNYQNQQNKKNKKAKGQDEQNGQCPQGSKGNNALSQKQKQQERNSRKIKKIKEIEKIKKDERSIIDVLRLNFLKFDMNKRYPEIFYYLLFAIIVPLFIIYCNATFLVACSLIVKPAIIKSFNFLLCLLIALSGLFVLLGLGLGLQHLLVKSSKNRKKVNKMILAIIAACFIAFPMLSELPVMCALKPLKEVVKQILEVILN